MLRKPPSLLFSSVVFIHTALLLIVFIPSAVAQLSPGVPNFSAYDSHEVDTINLMSNNILLSIPVMSKSGAFPLQYGLTNNFYMYNNYGTWSPTGSFWSSNIYGFGSSGGIVFVNYAVTSGVLCPDGKTYTTKRTNWYIQTGDGTYHYLDTAFYIDDAGCYSKSFAAPALDNSGLTVAADYSYTCCNFVKGLHDRSGNSLGIGGVSNQATVTDTNGNSINSTKVSGTVTFTDTLGLPALSVTTSGTNLTSTWTDINGGSPQIALTHSGSATWRSNFNCSGITDENGANQPTSTSINFPDATSMGITYEPTPGYSGDYTGRIGQITLRAGGTITYSYLGGNNGIDCTYQTVPELKRVTSDGTTTYTLTHYNTSGSYYNAQNTVVDNGGNTTVYTFSGFTSTGVAAGVAQVLTQIKRYKGTTTLLETDTYCYNQGIGSICSPTQIALYPIGRVIVYRQLAGMSTASAAETHYDAYGNVTYSAQYDFGASSPTVATATTYGTWNGTSCVSIGNYVTNKPCDVLTQAGSNNIEEWRYTYDSHGNLLTRYAWKGSAWLSNTTPNSYNSNGTTAASYDLANNQTTYSYSPGSYVSCGSCTNYPFATSISKGGLTTYSTWNGVGGVKLTDKDANGNTTTYGYQNSSGAADEFWRVMSVTDPLGNEAWNAYPSGSSPTTVNSSFTFNSGGSALNATLTADGYGRAVNVQKAQSPSSTNYDTRSTQYSWSGNYREVQGTLPCSTTLGSQCPFSSATTTTLVDPLGRAYTVTDGGGGTITKTYSQNDVLTVLSPHPTNENNKQVQKEYDGLGRLTKSCAIGNGYSTACGQNTGSANGVTDTYSYTSASGSTAVSTTRGSQMRSKTFDALGRVIQVVTPESGGTVYTYDASPSCPGSINGYLTAVNTPGTGVCFYRDSLGRVTLASASYSGSGTACRWFYYDNSAGYNGAIPSGITITNPYGRLVEAATDNCAGTHSIGSLITDEWFSYDKNGHMTDMWEMTPHSGQYYHSTATFYSNGAINVLTLASPNLFNSTYKIDGEGRWNQMTTYSVPIVPSQGVTFNAAGQPTLINIGTAGDSDAYTYDPNTGRMTNWSFTVGTKNESATLSWNANGTLNNLAITDGFNSGGTQTCYFNPSSGPGMGYDDWGRLLNDNCGSVWAQTFSYDQYDNLTKSGSSAWNPGYNSANNHYTLSGTSYDSNGNLLSDPVHRYAWNEFNKLKSIDSSACGTDGECVTYDALGRAVETSSGSTYTEIWYTQLGKTAYMNGSSFLYAYWPTPGGSTLLQIVGYAYNFQHRDWLGSARISSNLSTGIIDDRAFAPYGEMYQNFGSTSPRQLIFTGDTQDIVAGIYDTPNRELNPGQGRWLSPDPARAGWNAYAYGTNPNSQIDPTGLDIRQACGTWCGAFGQQTFGDGSTTGTWGVMGGWMPGEYANMSGLDPYGVPLSLFATYNPSIFLGSGQPSQDVPAPDISSVLAGQPNDQSVVDSVLGLPTATGAPAQIIIRGLLFSFDMQNGYIDQNGLLQTVFPGSPASAQVIGNAWSLQVANESGQPLAGNFSVTENVNSQASTGDTVSIRYRWTTDSTGGFVDNIFFAFRSPGNAAFLNQQDFTINGAPANSFYQFYNYYRGGLQFAYPLPTSSAGP